MAAQIARLFPDGEAARGDAAAQAFAAAVRVTEALLFAAAAPLAEAQLAERLPRGTDVGAVLARLRADYAGRGVVLVRVGTKWLFRTADDLGWLLSSAAREVRKLSRAATETLAIVAYHQPATRAEIEEIRGVAISKGTLDVLLETGWVKLRGRRRAPGRPITYGTTEAFLLHFGLESIADLPGLEELRGAGLFDGRLPPSFAVPMPQDGDLREDEDPLEAAPDEEAELYGPHDEDDGEAEEHDEPDFLGRDPLG